MRPFAICHYQYAIFKSLALAGLLVLFCGMLAQADEALRAEVIPAGGRFRSNAPTPLDVRLDWKGSGVLEGALEITLLDLGEPVLQALFLSRTIGFDTLSQLLPQRSPSGGQAVEDLDLEDASDPRQWIVIAWKLTGSDLQIFRRVYFTHE